MAPKTPKKAVDSSSEAASNIVALCHMLTCAEGGFGSTATLAPILGLSHGKNVPRKINQIITPYGFEFKGGKVVKIGEDGAPAATATPAADDTIAQATPATPATRKKMSKKATPAVKKRKIDETSSEEVNTEEVEAKGDDVDDEDGGN